MSAYAQTVRLNPSQARTLAGFATQRQLSQYAMLARVVDAGFAAILHGADQPVGTREIAAEVAAVSVQLAEIERVLDRALFTACAAYAYARHASLGTKKPDEVIAAEARAAFERQRSLASEVAS